MVSARPLVCLAEPGDVGVVSPKQKRYTMRTVFVLRRVDKKDANAQGSLSIACDTDMIIVRFSLRYDCAS